MSSKKRSSKLHKRHSRYGGFYDMASMRAELGDEQVDDMGPEAAQMLLNESLAVRSNLPARTQLNMYNEEKAPDTHLGRINANLQQRLEQTESESKRLHDEMRTTRDSVNRELTNIRNQASQSGISQSGISPYTSAPSLYIQRPANPLTDYFAKENIKREIKNEMVEAHLKNQRDKELAKLWASSDATSKPTKLYVTPVLKINTTSRSRSRSKGRSSSKSKGRSASKSKARTSSKSKAHTSSKSKTRNKSKGHSTR